MTLQAQLWLRWGVAMVAFALSSAPAAAAAGLAERTAAWTERIGTRIQAAPDPVAGLSDAQLAGQRVVVGFDGPRAPEAVRRRGAGGELGGVILFARNVSSRSQVRSLTADLQAAAGRAPGGRPLLVMIDQEGGQVSRLPGAPRRSPAEVGRSGSEAVARSEGRATGRSLQGVGINLDLAPVVDVARPGTNMRKLGRSYGGSAARVTRLAGAFAAGLRASGVLSCAKHWPGLGLARGDEDLRLNRIAAPLERLRAVDGPPFVGAHTDLVVVSTGLYPALDDSPALFSRPIATDELRGHLGFIGTTITDDPEVPALARSGGAGARARAAPLAGNDLLLFSESAQQRFAAGGAIGRALAAGTLAPAEFK